MIKICNGSGCPWEISSGENWGDCGKPPYGVCIDMYEDDSAYEAAQIEAAEYADLAAEAKWEALQERRHEI